MGKLIVANAIRKEDFEVPQEYLDLSNKIYAKETITKRDFIDLCLLAVNLVDTHWENRQGLAYHLVGMLANPLIQEDPLLDEIGSLFGELELPDHHIGGTEEKVKEQWQEVKDLVAKAHQKYPPLITN